MGTGWGGPGSSPPTFLHQPPVGGRAADKQEDAEEEQGQADARHGARCYAGRTRLRVLACGRTDVTAQGRHLPGLRELRGELLATYTRLGCGSRSGATWGCPGRGAGGGRHRRPPWKGALGPQCWRRGCHSAAPCTAAGPARCAAPGGRTAPASGPAGTPRCPPRRAWGHPPASAPPAAGNLQERDLVAECRGARRARLSLPLLPWALRARTSSDRDVEGLGTVPVASAAVKPTLAAAAVHPAKPPNPAVWLQSLSRWKGLEQACRSPRGLALLALARARGCSAGSRELPASFPHHACRKHKGGMDESVPDPDAFHPRTCWVSGCWLPSFSRLQAQSRVWGCSFQEPSAHGRFPVLSSRTEEEERQWVDGNVRGGRGTSATHGCSQLPMPTSSMPKESSIHSPPATATPPCVAHLSR